jgi:DedD protein
MERQRKERLVGAAVLVMLAVIFIPMILDDTVQPESRIDATNIPPRPEGEFESRVVPLTPEREETTAGRSIQGQGTAPAAVATGSATKAPAPATPMEEAPGPAAPAPAASGARPAAAAPPAAGNPAGRNAGVSAWVVQLGSFASEENAEGLNRKLRQAGFAAFVEPLQQGGATVYRVRVGPELRRSAAQSVRDRLKSAMDLDGIVVPYP